MRFVKMIIIFNVFYCLGLCWNKSLVRKSLEGFGRNKEREL